MSWKKWLVGSSLVSILGVSITTYTKVEAFDSELSNTTKAYQELLTKSEERQKAYKAQKELAERTCTSYQKYLGEPVGMCNYDWFLTDFYTD